MKSLVAKDIDNGLEYVLSRIMRDDNRGFHRHTGWRIDRIWKGGSITELSYRLDKKSKCLNRFAGTWPSNGFIHDFYVNEEHNLCIRYEDLLTEEIHFYPFQLDKESEWLATYDRNSCLWSLKRLRFIE